MGSYVDKTSSLSVASSKNPSESDERVDQSERVILSEWANYELFPLQSKALLREKFTHQVS